MAKEQVKFAPTQAEVLKKRQEELVKSGTPVFESNSVMEVDDAEQIKKNCVFNPKGKLVIESVSEEKIEKERIDKYAQRKFVSVVYAETTAPFRSVTRNFFQRYEDPITRQKPVWRGITPEKLNAFKKAQTEFDGSIVVAKVEPYLIATKRRTEDGKMVDAFNKVSQYQTVIFPGESITQVLRQANHAFPISIAPKAVEAGEEVADQHLNA